MNLRLSLYLAAFSTLSPAAAMADTIINYEFSADASLVVCAECGWVQYLSGGFAFDVTTGHVVSSTIYGTGWFGPFTNAVLLGSSTNSITVGYRVGQSVIIDFVNPLGSASDSISGSSTEVQYSMESVTGSADEFAPLPEPTTLAVIGAGLAGLGWVRRRRSNRAA